MSSFIEDFIHLIIGLANAPCKFVTLTIKMARIRGESSASLTNAIFGSPVKIIEFIDFVLTRESVLIRFIYFSLRCFQMVIN